MDYDVSVVMTLHNEGRIAYRSFRSISCVMKHAEKQGIKVELVVVMDNIEDQLLKNIIDDWREKIGEGFRAFTVNFGSLSLSRNHGIDNSHGEFIAILDGDDLFCEDWISKAYKTCSKNKNLIAHPEVTYYFPFERFIRFSNENPEAIINLVIYNQWTALTMAHSNVFHKIKYIKDVPPYAFQDWLWNCDTASEGYSHVIVPMTVVAVRQKPSGKSLWQNTHSQNKAVRANTHFRNIFLRNYDTMGEYVSPDQTRWKSNIWQRIQRSLADYFHEHYPNVLPVLMIIRRIFLGKIRAIRKKSRLPIWISTELARMTEIEPSINVTKNIEIRRPNKTNRVAGAITPGMAELVKTKDARIFIVDHLGKDDATLNLFNYMRNQGRVFLITTEKTDNNIPKCLNSEIIHVPIDNSNLFFEERLTLLHRLLLQTDILWIHIFNSRLAFKMLEKYRKTLHGCKIYTTISSPSSLKYEFDGSLIEYTDLFDSFSNISTNSELLNKRIFEVYGSFRTGISRISFPYDPEFFKCFYEIKNNPDMLRYSKTRKGKHLRIMVTGLPNHPKRADQIISNLSNQFSPDRSIEIAVWGDNKLKTKGSTFSPFEADICVCYDYFPGIDTFFIQLMGSGIPVFVRNERQFSELFSDRTVCFFDENLSEAYNKIEQMTNEKTLSHQINYAKNYIMEKFSTEVVGHQIKDFYEDSDKFNGLI